uniref:Solute carrier family 35 member F3 n=1 Tax=Sinocyclocheilus grahami TaxID=75366 RepID=A0A672MLG1_SINGR
MVLEQQIIMLLKIKLHFKNIIRFYFIVNSLVNERIIYHYFKYVIVLHRVLRSGVESGAGRQRLHCCVRVTAIQVRKAIWGVAMVMCVCSSWAGSTQLAKLTFKQYDAPFTLTWFTTTWNCLFFPLYYIGHLCKSPERQTPKQRFRECCRFFGDDGLTAKVFFTKVAPFGLLWIMTNYLYLQALRKINSTDVSALFCCNKAFVFLLSWIVLRDRFMGVRVSGWMDRWIDG